ncbi:MAG TPA: hypothetical protein VHI13_08550 [Candidatus Kapabacteria bacterium]|nr:hypothetical protein [Candidatus Kapabacteria bacterium]
MDSPSTPAGSVARSVIDFKLPVAKNQQALVLVRFTGTLAKWVSVYFPNRIKVVSSCEAGTTAVPIVLDNHGEEPMDLQLVPECSEKECPDQNPSAQLNVILQYESSSPMRHWLLSASEISESDTISITIIVQPGIIIDPGSGDAVRIPARTMP